MIINSRVTQNSLGRLEPEAYRHSRHKKGHDFKGQFGLENELQGHSVL